MSMNQNNIETKSTNNLLAELFAIVIIFGVIGGCAGFFFFYILSNLVK